MMPSPTPDQVLNHIADAQPATSSPIAVYWVKVGGDRDKYAAELTAAASGRALLPCVLRRIGFRDPNVVMQDLFETICDHRDECTDAELAEAAGRQGRLDLVLLARTDLNVAITSSPVMLPDWFPIRPGETVHAPFIDLTWRTAISLADDVVGVPDLARLIYEYDSVLQRVVDRSFEEDRNRVNSLLDRLRQEKDPADAFEWLTSSRRVLLAVENPSSYRPSTVRTPTLVGRIWYCLSTTAPDSRLALAKAFERAVSLSDEVGDRRLSFLGVLDRPSNPVNDPVRRWVVSQLSAIRGGCQLITASAHADEYPKFSESLLRAMSLDIRSCLDEGIAIFGG